MNIYQTNVYGMLTVGTEKNKMDFGYRTDHKGYILHQKKKVIYSSSQLYQNMKLTETRVGKISGIRIRII